nr:PREDICTED: DNA damage-induced apoptosis suppressor protein [Struthio camelus australis]
MSGGRALLAASVISIQNSCFIYPACQSCFSRLILDSRRFNCLKCGCTGEATEASYRYRLSLKIADTNDLFDITVFGSCLDPFFGVTAGNLQRYIQDFNQLSGETNKDASPGELVQAVETCFIGKRFIFGVKIQNTLHHCNKQSTSRYDALYSPCQCLFPGEYWLATDCFLFSSLQILTKRLCESRWRAFCCQQHLAKLF